MKIDLFFAYLTTIIATCSAEAQNLWNTDNLTLKDETHLLRKDITDASGDHDLIDANTAKVKAISTFDGTKLDAGNVFLFDQIAIGYTRASAGTALYASKYQSAPVAALRSAFLEIRQDGKQIVYEPCANMIVNGTPQAPEEAFLQLRRIYHIKDDRNFTIKLIFGSGAMTQNSTDLEQIELRIKGMGTVPKAS